VSIDQPSDGILFDRCSWTSLSSSTGLIFITTAWKNNFAVQEKEEEEEEKSAATTTTIESLSSRSTVVLLSNCSFTNIKYNFPLIATYDSSVIISDTTFDNIHLLPKENSCGVNESNYGTAFFQEARTTSTKDTDTTSDGGSGIVECAYVLACGGTVSNCTIAGQSCLTTPNVSVASPTGSWLQVGNGSTYTINEASNDCGFS